MKLGLEGDEIIYMCPTYTATANGLTNITFMCKNGTWTPLGVATYEELIRTFICEPCKNINNYILKFRACNFSPKK